MTVTPKRNCANCGRLFTPKDSRSLYCRSACRTALFRKRKKANNTDTTPEAIAQSQNMVWEIRTVPTNVRNPVYSDMEAVLTNKKAKLEQLKNEERQCTSSRGTHL